jgi:hypothetical protein
VDPDATWEELCDALRQYWHHPNDVAAREQAVSCLKALTEWLQKGGFAPTIE